MNTLHLAALLVCHNRVKLTLSALEALQKASEASGVRVSIVLYDDASTDGTPAAVKAAFPDAMIVQGDGTAFWNRGHNIAWRAAMPLPVDGFLWLNDDVTLDPDALSRTRTCWVEAMRRRPAGEFILVGATRGENRKLTYGGKRRVRSPWALRFQDIQPANSALLIDAFNGNYVVVPRRVTDLIGLNDPAFFHNMGDIDYGLRARRKGIDIWLMPETIGVCPDNDKKANSGYGSPSLSLFQQWRKVNTHHGVPFLSWARLTFRHSGIWFPLHFLLPYRHLVIPGIFRKWGNPTRQLG